MDMDITAIILVMCLIVFCLAPNIREILLVISLCINAMSLTNGFVKLTATAKSMKNKKDKFCGEPNFTDLSEKNFDELLYAEIPKPVPEEYTSNFANYKGRVDYSDAMPMNNGNDRMARLALKRQGDKIERQIAGSSNIRKNMEIYVQNDVVEDEHKYWWGAYDH